MIYVGTELTVPKASEKNAVRMLISKFVYVHVTVISSIRNNAKIIKVNIVFPPRYHCAVNSSDAMLIRWRCEGYTMLRCLSKTIGNYVSPSHCRFVCSKN